MFAVCVLGLGLCLAVSPAALALARLHRRLEHHLDRIARQRLLCIAFAGVLPVVLRLMLLPWFPVPLPTVPDEFAHILVGQTFAEGRITNPPHLLWPHFESLFILQRPTYTGLYQAGYGATLAVGRLLTGSLWAGVCLSEAAALSALCWMLYQWLPRRYALLGITFAIVTVGAGSIWLNSYLVIPVTALGGCLVLGALRRMRRSDFWLAAFGLAILLHTRPYDAVLLGVVFGVSCLVRQRGQARLLAWAGVRAILFVLMPAFGLLLYYNWCVTGNPLKLPYLVAREQYGVPQTFLFQPPVLRSEFRHPELRQVYLGQLQIHENRLHPGELAAHYVSRVLIVWRDYLHAGWLPLLVLLPVAAQYRRTRLVTVAVSVAILGQCLYFYFASHYLAPIYGGLLVLAMQAFRRLRYWRVAGRPAGMALALTVTLMIWTGGLAPLLGLPLQRFLPAVPHLDTNWFYKPKRAAIFRELQHHRGPQLVFVRYGAPHEVLDEYVYNEPRIDNAPVVWARDMGAERNSELLRYYPGREAWLLEPDREPFRLRRYGDALERGMMARSRQ